MKGRPPKHPKLHLLQGTHRADRHGPEGRDLPNVKLSVDLEPPDYLDAYALGVWKLTVGHLEMTGLLADVDQHLLALYCLWISIARQCAQELEEAGELSTGTQRGGKRKHPSLSTLKDAIECTTKLAGLFGIGPTSRARMIHPEKKAKYSSLLD